MDTVLISIILFINFGTLLSKQDFKFEVDRMEAIPGTEETLVDYSKCRFIRQGSEYFGNGTLIYNADLGEEITHEIKTMYSPSGTNLFHKHPYTVQKSSICEFFKTFYVKYGQPWVTGHTDFPHIPEEGLCPLPKGNYYIKNMPFNVGQPDHAPAGLWKLEQIFSKDNKVVGGMTIIGKVVPKSN